ncbi:MAG: phosphatidate cytidylyltransferase [Elusimicrobia bacterium]|nr:phosphatidate cytidylyltransferase [Elusimicrobiota bacterium]
MLLPRVLTAMVGVPLLLWLIHLGSLPFVAFVVCVATAALYEYALLLWVGGRGIQRFTCVAGGGLLALAVALGSPGPGRAMQGGLPGLLITAVVLVAMFREMFRSEHSMDRAALTLFGVFFVGWTLAHLALIRDLRPHGEQFTYLLFVTVWIMDTAAYFVGKRFGRHKLASVISPGKTWEGAAAGFVGAILVGLAAQRFWMADAMTPALAASLGMMLGVVGQASDLAESVVKRAVGAKDSSALLPGHGGILDRFDSFLLAAPMMYYVLIIWP